MRRTLGSAMTMQIRFSSCSPSWGSMWKPLLAAALTTSRAGGPAYVQENRIQARDACHAEHGMAVHSR